MQLVKYKFSLPGPPKLLKKTSNFLKPCAFPQVTINVVTFYKQLVLQDLGS